MKRYSTYEKQANILEISKKTSIRDILETKMQSNYNHKTRLIWLLEEMLPIKVTDREFLWLFFRAMNHQKMYRFSLYKNRQKEDVIEINA